VTDIKHKPMQAVRAAAAGSALLLASLVLVACGESGGAPTTTSVSAGRPADRSGGSASRSTSPAPTHTSTTRGSASKAPGSATTTPGSTATTRGRATTPPVRTPAAPTQHPKPPAGVAVPATGSLPERAKALHECLQREGAAGPHGQGTMQPNGMSRGQYKAILKKCGAGPLLSAFLGSEGHSKPSTPRQALSRWAACMRANGVDIPAPSASQPLPLPSKGLNTGSATYKRALAKCSSGQGR
jgi:hypothetical protein